jgi:hypothetical protein
MLLGLLSATLSVSGCSGLLSRGGSDQVVLRTNAVNPAAMGTVAVSRDGQNQNTKLAVDVAHLADPKKMSPDANTYVVWALPKDAVVPYNLGALRVDEDLKGHLDTTTAFNDFAMFVTVEPAPNVSTPGAVRVLEGNVRAAAE